MEWREAVLHQVCVFLFVGHIKLMFLNIYLNMRGLPIQFLHIFLDLPDLLSNCVSKDKVFEKIIHK